jgi:hypothetical protein
MLLYQALQSLSETTPVSAFQLFGLTIQYS